MSEDNIVKSDGYRQFNLSRDKVLDSWNSDYMKNIRLKMLAGDPLVNCVKCVDAESKGLTSMRTTMNKQMWIESTNIDGSVDHKPSSLELHFGNTCNLHCKMCSQQFSHMIGKELLKMGQQDPDFLQWVKRESGVVNNWTGELDIKYDWYKNTKIKKSIFEHVSNDVDNLVVIGGEPTIIPEFYELLEYCHSKNTLNGKSLVITTNMTNTNKNLSTWLGSVKDVMIHASIDGLNERNKYIRYPCDWDSVLKSLQFYRSIISQHRSAHLSFAPAIQLLNIDQLPALCEFFIDNFVTERCGIAWVSQVRYPVICDYSILPIDYRHKVADILESKIGTITHQHTGNKISTHVNDLRNEIYTDEQKISYQKMFIRYNDQQDKFRNTQSWRSLLPDLEQSLTKTTK